MESSGTSVSYWMDTQKIPAFPHLTEDITADTVVIGGGIAGLTTAYVLATKGVDVVLLEKGRILRGETERTTAHLATALDERYSDIIRWAGKERTTLAAESHASAIDFIEDTIKKERIDCGFTRLDGYMISGEGEDPTLLDEELEAAHSVGIPIEKCDNAPLKEYHTGPCLRFPNQAQFHPTDYLCGLAHAAVKAGARIFTESAVTDIEEDEQPVRVHTQNGKMVRAQKLIVATNSPINDNALIFSKLAAYRCYVIGVEMPANRVHKALYWDTNDPYHYVRLAEGKTEGTDVLMVGGEDHKTGQEYDMDERWKRIEDWTRRHFPSAGKLVYTWSGQVFDTPDKLAMIGHKPGGKPWSFIATGDSGIGMTHGTIAGLLLAELSQGKNHRWKEVYDPSRWSMFKDMDFYKENLNVAGEMVKHWVKPSEKKSAQDIAPGSGAIMQQGIQKIALYRDDAGAFHACSAVCPHKGCVVQWNDGEKSWDCPCHGSRYDAKGEVLTGPTRKNLEPLPDWKE